MNLQRHAIIKVTIDGRSESGSNVAGRRARAKHPRALGGIRRHRRARNNDEQRQNDFAAAENGWRTHGFGSLNANLEAVVVKVFPWF
jgi:hypothetical protein